MTKDEIISFLSQYFQKRRTWFFGPIYGPSVEACFYPHLKANRPNRFIEYALVNKVRNGKR